MENPAVADLLVGPAFYFLIKFVLNRKTLGTRMAPLKVPAGGLRVGIRKIILSVITNLLRHTLGNILSCIIRMHRFS